MLVSTIDDVEHAFHGEKFKGDCLLSFLLLVFVVFEETELRKGDS
jgi:hypothetical protein